MGNSVLPGGKKNQEWRDFLTHGWRRGKIALEKRGSWEVSIGSARCEMSIANRGGARVRFAQKKKKKSRSAEGAIDWRS